MMKRLAIVCGLLFIGLAATAQQPPAPPQQSNEEMVRQMQLMQRFQAMSRKEFEQYIDTVANGSEGSRACFLAAGGKEGVQKFVSLKEYIDGRIQLLCQAKERKAAFDYAFQEGGNMLQDPFVVKFMECSKMVPDTHSGEFIKHVCDQDWKR